MLALSYCLLSSIMFLFCLFIVFSLQKRRGKNTSRVLLKTLLVLGIWFVYLIILSATSFLTHLQLPPRLPLFVFLPFTIFSIIFYRRAIKSDWIQDLPLNWLTYPQSFRIFVEFILLYSFYAEIVPKEATFKGLNYDILIGISAPLIAYFVFRKPNLNKPVAAFWNILGICMILFVASIIGTSFYNPGLWGSEQVMVSTQFVQFPYLLVAGFLAPLGIFMHVVSLAKIKSMR